MDLNEKSHAALNYSLGTAGITSPWWLEILKLSEFWMQYLTVAGGFILIIIQLYRTLKNKKEE